MTPERTLAARGRSWAIAAPHAAASAAGAEAFERGGNAIDAALAAATTLAVVYPHMCGVGGDLFALVQHPEGDVVAVTSTGRVPAHMDVERVRTMHLGRMPERGPFTISVPGAPGGWAALHDQGAVLPWADHFSRALRAADGEPVSVGLAEQLAGDAGLLAADPGMAEIFFSEGKPLLEGDRCVQPALARTLDAIAGSGAGALYGGPVGSAYVDGLRATGSPIDLEDLAAHRSEVHEPLMAPFRDLRVRTSPPTSQGVTMLEAMLAIDRLGADPDPFGDDAGVLALVFAAVARDRALHLADPDRMRVHPDALLDDEHIAALCNEVKSGLTDAPQPAATDTAGLVTADAEGYAVSLIQSLAWGFGSAILEPSTGIVAQNRASGSSLDPDHPDVLAPGMRPAHTLMPVMAHRGDRLAAVSGTMGGPAHPQINTWSLVRSLFLGHPPDQAVALPRWLAGGMDDEAGVATAEPGVPEPVIGALERAGFQVHVLHERDSSVGHAHLITFRADGEMDVGTDPRADGAALAT